MCRNSYTSLYHSSASRSQSLFMLNQQHRHTIPGIVLASQAVTIVAAMFKPLTILSPSVIRIIRAEDYSEDRYSSSSYLIVAPNCFICHLACAFPSQQPFASRNMSLSDFPLLNPICFVSALALNHRAKQLCLGNCFSHHSKLILIWMARAGVQAAH